MEKKSRTRVLVVDDELYTQEFLKVSLEDAGFECVVTGEPDAALREVTTTPVEVAFVGAHVGGMPAVEFVKQIRSRSADTVVVVAAAVEESRVAFDAIRGGAYDHVPKPLSVDLVRLAAVRAAERRRLEVGARDYQRYLQQVADERAAETRRLFYCMTRVLIRLFELKSPYKSGHPLKVAEMSRHVGHELKMTEDGVRKVYLAALLADIGMIAVHDAILTKTAPLTEDEYKRIQEHVSTTEEVLRPILDDEEVLKNIHHHHERYDGAGYPDGLRGNLIPLGSRIISVVEAFVAMTKERPYRRPLEADDALAELDRCCEKQFDPQVVAVFKDLYEKVFRTFDNSHWVMP